MTFATSSEKAIPGKSKGLQGKSAMSNALAASLNAETDSFQARLEKAKIALDAPTAVSPSRAQRKATSDMNAVETDLREQPSRVVRDAFTMPEEDYALIERAQQRCLKNAVRLTKSEALRAGLQALAQMSDSELLVAVERLEKVRTGRPKLPLRE